MHTHAQRDTSSNYDMLKTCFSSCPNLGPLQLFRVLKVNVTGSKYKLAQICTRESCNDVDMC